MRSHPRWTSPVVLCKNQGNFKTISLTLYQTPAWFSWASYGITGCCRGTSLGLDCCLFPQADWSPISDHSSEKFKFKHPKTRSEITALVFPSMDREGWRDVFVPTNWKCQAPLPHHILPEGSTCPHICSIYYTAFILRGPSSPSR